MTLEEKITALLRTVCPRVFSDFAPVNTPRPYVTYQQIGGDSVTFMDRTVASKENATIQVSVWSESRPEGKAMIMLIEQTLIGAADPQCDPLAAASNDFDSDISRYSSRQDFSCWADR